MFAYGCVLVSCFEVVRTCPSKSSKGVNTSHVSKTIRKPQKQSHCSHNTPQTHQKILHQSHRNLHVHPRKPPGPSRQKERPSRCAMHRPWTSSRSSLGRTKGFELGGDEGEKGQRRTSAWSIKRCGNYIGSLRGNRFYTGVRKFSCRNLIRFVFEDVEVDLQQDGEGKHQKGWNAEP